MKRPYTIPQQTFRMMIVSLSILHVCAGALAADGPTLRKLPHAFFPMNFARHDPELSSSPEMQARLLKEVGYDGTFYLGPLSGLTDWLQVADTAGLKVFAAAVTPYNVSVDPGQTYPAVLKDAIRQLEERKTLLIFQFVSKQYERGYPEGDARAVELGRELADYARQYGVRLAVYPHVNIWCERVDHATRIVKKCDRENLGICFNLFHWLRTDQNGDLPSLVREAMPHLFLVTVNGTSREGSIQTLDRGEYDVAGFLQPFVEAGYRGPIGLQCVGIQGDVRDNLVRSMDAWKQVAARLVGRKATIPPKSGAFDDSSR